MPTLTSDRPFILRTMTRPLRGPAKPRHFVSPALSVSQIDEHRPTGRNLGGMFTEVESTGRKVAGIIRVRTTEGTLDGHGHRREHGTHLKTNAAAVKKELRRVRAEELALIATADAEVEAAEAALKEARSRRAALVAEAWTKAHVVTVKELQEALSN